MLFADNIQQIKEYKIQSFSGMTSIKKNKKMLKGEKLCISEKELQESREI